MWANPAGASKFIGEHDLEQRDALLEPCDQLPRELAAACTRSFMVLREIWDAESGWRAGSRRRDRWARTRGAEETDRALWANSFVFPFRLQRPTRLSEEDQGVAHVFVNDGRFVELSERSTHRARDAICHVTLAYAPHPGHRCKKCVSVLRKLGFNVAPRDEERHAPTGKAERLH